MADDALERLTLREKLTEVERMIRDLSDHIEQGVIPKTKDLYRLVRKYQPNETESQASDRTVREHASELITIERFTEQAFEKISRYHVSIDDEITRIIEGS